MLPAAALLCSGREKWNDLLIDLLILFFFNDDFVLVAFF